MNGEALLKFAYVHARQNINNNGTALKKFASICSQGTTMSALEEYSLMRGELIKEAGFFNNVSKGLKNVGTKMVGNAKGRIHSFADAPKSSPALSDTARAGAVSTPDKMRQVGEKMVANARNRATPFNHIDVKTRNFSDTAKPSTTSTPEHAAVVRDKYFKRGEHVRQIAQDYSHDAGVAGKYVTRSFVNGSLGFDIDTAYGMMPTGKRVAGKNISVPATFQAEAPKFKRISPIAQKAVGVAGAGAWNAGFGFVNPSVGTPAAPKFPRQMAYSIIE